MLAESVATRSIDILLVEDDPGDAGLAEALKDRRIRNTIYGQFMNVVASIEDCWLTIVKLPPIELP